MIHEDVQLLNNEPQFQSPSVTASLTMTGWQRRKLALLLQPGLTKGLARESLFPE